MISEPQNSQPPAQSDNKYTIIVQQLKNSFQTTGPGNRMNHSIAYYGQQIFVFGGTSASNLKQDEHYRIVYWYSLYSKLWTRKEFPALVKSQDREKDRDKVKEKEKQKEKEKEKQNEMEAEKEEEPCTSLASRSYMASCRKDHQFYLFGGSNCRNECNNELLLFDMKEYQWLEPQSINPPEPRESSYLIPFMDNYLLLYGGIDVQRSEIFETFYSYRIDTGTWRQIEQGNYRDILRPRYLTSLCSVGQGEKMFLFGGQYRTSDGYHSFLSDFYELTVSVVKKASKMESETKNKSHFEEILAIECVMLKAHNNLNQEQSTQSLDRKFPQAKSAHKLLSLNDQYIILIGGANFEHYYLCNAWVYNISCKLWRKIQFDITVPKQAGTDCCVGTKLWKQFKWSSAQKEVKEEVVPPAPKEPKELRQLKEYTGRRKDNKQRPKEREIRDRDKSSEPKIERKYNSIYIYGGLNCYDSVRCDLYRLEFEPTPEEMLQQSVEILSEKGQEEVSAQKEAKKTLEQLFYVQPLKKCLFCEFPKPKVVISKSIIDGFTSMIPYPFNAIGLFLENAHNNNAAEFCVAYRNEVIQMEQIAESKKNEDLSFRFNQRFESLRKKMQHSQQIFYTKTQPFLHISQSNQIQNLCYEELKSSMKNFEYLLYFTYHNIEKKVRNALQRQHQLHQYGTYLKAGALRLGSQFIYLSKGNQGEIRVFAFLIIKTQGQQKERNYEFCSYVWSTEKKKVIEEPEKLKKFGNHHKNYPEEELSSREFYEYSYNRITERYQRYIQDLFQANAFEDKPNHLLIFHLKQTFKKPGENTLELFSHTDTVDICYTPYRKMLLTHAPGIYESIDLSMRAYMSSYFLKSEFPKMFIKINNLSKQVASQICLESFDLMAKNKSIYEIDNGLINIEVKLMELYFNPVLTTSMISFHNGVLFYHRGRLVARHGCPIGELYKKTNNKSYNYFHLFGLLQVPEPILPNVFRTEFIFNVMMEKLRSRLKFIENKLILEFDSHDGPQMIKNTSEVSNSLLIRAISQEKTLKITKKLSQTKEKEKRQKKEDVEFNPNIKY